MFKSHKLIIIIIVAVLVVSATVATTVALLIAYSGPLENVFTIGNIKISLTETTGSTYQLIPGKVIEKDPTVRVEPHSEDCWLFVKVTKSKDFDNYIITEMADGWTHLGGFEGVYYRSVYMSGSGDVYSVLKNNSMTVVDSLTEEKMTAIEEVPSISFKAYAVQSHGIDTASEAWIEILKEDAG